MKTLLMVLLVLIASAATAVAGYFYGFDQGQTQAQNVRAEFFSQRAGAPSGAMPEASQTGQPGQAGQRAGGNLAARGTAGTIKSVQGNTLQLTAADGSAVNVTLDAQTTIQKLAPGASADLQAGQRVTIQGNTTGGTLTARLIIVGLGQ